MKTTACKLLVVSALSSTPVLAEETPQRSGADSRNPLVETGTEHDHLTGNWGGLRDKWLQRGVHMSAGYIGEVMANVAGGVRRGAVYEGLGEAAVELDLTKLGAGWSGGQFRASGLWLHGGSPTGKHIGDLQTASNIDGYDSVRLYEVWYQQNLWDDRFSLRAGQQLADKEFATTEYGGLFFNSSFGWPAFISANTVNTGPAFFVATPGVRLRWETGERTYLQGGVYDGDSFDSAAGDPRVNPNGTHWHMSGAQGFFAIVEAGFALNQREGDAGLPGTYKAGGWVHTGTFADTYFDAAGGSFIVTGLAPRAHGDNFGLYAVAEQMVWREGGAGTDEGLGIFLRGGMSPSDRSLVELALDGGFQYTGLIPGREADVCGVGVAYAKVSRDLRRQQRDDRDLNGTAYAALASHEITVEASYRVELKPWWSLQPGCQYIINPGGAATTGNAVVLGVRTSVTF